MRNPEQYLANMAGNVIGSIGFEPGDAVRAASAHDFAEKMGGHILNWLGDNVTNPATLGQVIAAAQSQVHAAARGQTGLTSVMPEFSCMAWRDGMSVLQHLAARTLAAAVYDKLRQQNGRRRGIGRSYSHWPSEQEIYEASEVGQD